MCKETERDYYCLKIEEIANDQKKVFSIGDEVMHNRKHATLPIVRMKDTFNNESLSIVHAGDDLGIPSPVLDMIAPTTCLHCPWTDISYTSPVGQIYQHHGIGYCFYAYDNHLYQVFHP